jgi:hypothetical protein
MDQKAEDRVYIFPMDEANEPNDHAHVQAAAGIQRSHGYLAIAQLIHDGTGTIETGDVNVKARVAREPNGQLTHNGRRSADLQIRNEQENSRLHVKAKFNRFIPRRGDCAGQSLRSDYFSAPIRARIK